MRTTIDIEDDVLSAVKALAVARKTTAGKILSALARQSLTQPAGEPAGRRNGFRLLPRTGKIVTPELIEKLLDEDS